MGGSAYGTTGGAGWFPQRDTPHVEMATATLSAALGAELSGVDLSQPLDDATVASIRAAWLEHLVLVFRDQRVSDADLVAFSRHVGQLDQVPGWEDFHSDGHPEVLVISNVTEHGTAIGVLGDGEAAWHTDMSYRPDPPIASVLLGVEVPPTGGDTSFMSMYAALEALPPELRAELDRVELNHDDSRASTGELRPGHAEVIDVSRAGGARHPIIRPHPETGRPALYLGRRLNAYVVGMSVAASEDLLDRVWATLDAPGLIYRHRWRAGDVVMWDNRCTMHRRDAFDPGARRIMHRTQIRA